MALMQEHTTRRIYDFQAHFYDSLIAYAVRRRQQSAISRMNIQPGQWVLDIGIGTGLSLQLYPRHCHVVGIDLSEGMLSRARQRIEQHRPDYSHLVLGDAMFMPFQDNSFDFVLLSHVITVVSDPLRLLEHIRRVGKPGCRIVIINHFQSGYRPIACLEKLISPICVKLGWRTDLNLHELLPKTRMELDFRYKLDNFDFWEIVFLRNHAPVFNRYELLTGKYAAPTVVKREEKPSPAAMSR